MLAILATTVPHVAESADSKSRALRRARKVLRAVSLVDGPGSGLDADSVQGLTPPMVRDANGAFVGALVSLTDDSSGAGWVIRRIGEHPARFHVGSRGFSVGWVPVFFESGDCTGQPLLVPSGGLFPDAAAVSSQLIYYSVESPAPHTSASLLRLGETTQSCTAGFGGTAVPPDGCCIAFAGGESTLSTAQTLDLSTLELFPPFRLDVLPLPEASSSTTTTLP